MAVLSLGGCGHQAPKPKPVPVSTVSIKAANFRDLGDYISTLEAVDEVKLAAVTGGRIAERLVQEGDQVRQGQVLLRLRVRERTADLMEAKAKLANSEAQVSEVRARLEKDKANYQRYQYLKGQGASSAQELDSYRSQFLSQQASLKASQDGVLAAKAALEAAGSRLSDKIVTAPIPGQVSSVQVKLGDVIKEGDPFTSILRNDRLLTRIEIPATQVAKTRPGLPVYLQDPSSRLPLAEGRLSFVNPMVDASTQALLTKAEFANPSAALRSGLRVRTLVQFGQKQQLAVPFAAVSQSAGQSFVYVLGQAADLPADQREGLGSLPPNTPLAIKLPVRLGPLQNNCYPVLAGLRPGQRLINSNLLSLRNGTVVKPRPSKRSAPVCSPDR
jgi:RND family efflux transporter MFP subunit